jgi:hypothetical protein
MEPATGVPAAANGVPPAVVAELEAGAARLGATLASLPDAHWARRPAPDAWSAAEIVEHLILVEQGIGRLLAERLPGAPDDPDPAPDAMESRIRAAMGNRVEIRVKSPEPFAPTGRFPTPAALREAMAATRAATLALARGGAVPFRLRRAPHPRFGPLDGVQWLVFAAAHAERHLEQLREAVAAIAPGST